MVSMMDMNLNKSRSGKYLGVRAMEQTSNLARRLSTLLNWLWLKSPHLGIRTATSHTVACSTKQPGEIPAKIVEARFHH